MIKDAQENSRFYVNDGLMLFLRRFLSFMCSAKTSFHVTTLNSNTEQPLKQELVLFLQA